MRAWPGVLAGLALLAACAGPRPVAPPAGVAPGDASPAAFQAFRARAGETFVEDPSHGRLWLGVISQELAFDQAEVYCRRLPPHAGVPWRLPGVEALAAAPFGRYRLPDPPLWLWSATPPPGDTFRRLVLAPYTGAREAREVGGAARGRVLCVTDLAP